MAWGIMMTVVALVGMLGLLISNTSQQGPRLTSKEPDAVSLAAVEQQRAA
jgi:xanthosine utilization system XapX-like protein